MARTRSRMTRRGRADDGFTIIELVAAVSIMALGFLALASSFGSATRMLVQGRQRQVASEEANGMLEHIRNIPYTSVRLSEQPVRSTDPENPNYWVSSTGDGYDHDHDGVYEALAVDAATGEVPHRPDGGTKTIGSTVLDLYQYVTWVDDPPGGATTMDYKRLIVVASYKRAGNEGRPRAVQVTALFTPGTVSVGGTVATANQGTAGSPTPSPSPTPTSGSCSGDTQGPTGQFVVLSSVGAEQGYTNSTLVTIQPNPVDTCLPIQVRFSNNNGGAWGPWITYNPDSPTVTWELTVGDGTKRIDGQARDGIGNIRDRDPKNITLDQTRPTVPGTLTRTASCAGADRTVNLSWGASTDTNLLGYRIYRQINGGGWQPLATSSGQSYADTHAKGLNSVDYKVAAYDKAGNEGNPTNVVSLAKNQCS